MFISSISEKGAAPALQATMAYTQRRHAVIANNIANWGTPEYKTKQLDPKKFQAALGQALDNAKESKDKKFNLPGTDEFHVDSRGGLKVTPTRDPAENLSFHDGTNMSVERQMADLAENAMMHELSTTILSGYFDGARKAIRGRL